MTDTDDTETTGESTADEERSILHAWADGKGGDDEASADEETTDGGPVRERLAAVREGTDARRVASIGATVLAVALVLPFVVYAVPGVVGASHSYVVLSGSMEPTMSPGDVIVVEDVDPANVEEGDVLTFRRDEGARPTTHRVVAVNDGGDQRTFRTEGDANEDPDRELVTPDEIEGRVMTVAGHPVVFPYVGYVITVAGTQAGFLLLFGVPVVLLVGGGIRDLVGASGTDAAATDDGDAEADESDDGDEILVTDVDGATAADAEDAADDDGEDVADDEPTADDDETAADDDAALTFTTGELLLGLGALCAFFAYSVWVAYVTVAVWAFAVAGTVGATALLLGSLYLFGGGTSEEDDTASAEDDVPDGLPAADDLFAGWSAGDGGETITSAGDDVEVLLDGDDPEILLDADDPFDDWDLPDAWDDDQLNTPDEIVFGDDGREGMGDD
jgi:signal peptidase